MKKLLLLIPAALLALSACNRTKTTSPEDFNGLPVFEFEAEDTTAVQSLVDDFVEHFHTGNITSASNMLYIVRNDSVLPLPEDQKEGFRQALTSLNVYDCAAKEMNLYSNRDNELRIVLQIVPDGNVETEEGTINFFLNPVLQDGEWYLTLMNEFAEGVGLYH